jgi:hypothetical protein
MIFKIAERKSDRKQINRDNKWELERSKFEMNVIDGVDSV